VSESPIHRLSYAVLFMCIVAVVAEKGGGKVHGIMVTFVDHGHFLCKDMMSETSS